MKNLIIFIVLSFVSNISVSSQGNSGCPTISVLGPDDLVPLGQHATLTANVVGGSFDKIYYSWSISSGKIIEGQGTPVLKVDNEKEGYTITATVEITGLPANCPKSASATAPFEVILCDGLPIPVKIGEFSSPPTQIRKEGLDALFIALNNDPATVGYILEVFKKNTPRLQIKRKLSKLYAYMKIRRFDASRIFLSSREGDKYLTQFWIVPPGANRPIFDDFARINFRNYKQDSVKIFAEKQKNSRQKTKKNN